MATLEPPSSSTTFFNFCKLRTMGLACTPASSAQSRSQCAGSANCGACGRGVVQDLPRCTQSPYQLNITSFDMFRPGVQDTHANRIPFVAAHAIALTSKACRDLRAQLGRLYNYPTRALEEPGTRALDYRGEMERSRHARLAEAASHERRVFGPHGRADPSACVSAARIAPTPRSAIPSWATAPFSLCSAAQRIAAHRYVSTTFPHSHKHCISAPQAAHTPTSWPVQSYTLD